MMANTSSSNTPVTMAMTLNLPPCKFFGTEQGCRNGNFCRFPHVDPQSRRAYLRSSKNNNPYDFSNGYRSIPIDPPGGLSNRPRSWGHCIVWNCDNICENGSKCEYCRIWEKRLDRKFALAWDYDEARSDEDDDADDDYSQSQSDYQDEEEEVEDDENSASEDYEEGEEARYVQNEEKRHSEKNHHRTSHTRYHRYHTDYDFGKDDYKKIEIGDGFVKQKTPSLSHEIKERSELNESKMITSSSSSSNNQPEQEVKTLTQKSWASLLEQFPPPNTSSFTVSNSNAVVRKQQHPIYAKSPAYPRVNYTNRFNAGYLDFSFCSKNGCQNNSKGHRFCDMCYHEGKLWHHSKELERVKVVKAKASPASSLDKSQKDQPNKLEKEPQPKPNANSNSKEDTTSTEHKRSHSDHSASKDAI